MDLTLPVTTENLTAELTALEQQPSSPRNSFLRAETLLKLGRYAEALSNYGERTRMGGSGEEIYLSFMRSADCLEQLGYPENEIVGQLYRANYLQPNRFDALVRICRMLRNSEQYDASYRLSMVQPQRTAGTIQLDARSEWQILEEHALAALALDHVEEAKEYFALVAGYELPDEDRERIEELVKLTSETVTKDMRSVDFLAKALMSGTLEVTSHVMTARRQELAAAEERVKLDPTPGNYLNLSFAYHQLNRPADCIDAARMAIKLKPDYADAYNNIAASYMVMKDWALAVEAASEAVRLNPDYQLARNNLAAAETNLAKRKKSSK